jgi:hypothetical protein
MSLALTVTALHLFGKDAFFQPYLPLQQIEMLQAPSWLAGTTNQIVTQQKDCKYDVLVNVSRKQRSSHSVSDSQMWLSPAMNMTGDVIGAWPHCCA